jgi:hypothetical protein
MELPAKRAKVLSETNKSDSGREREVSRSYLEVKLMRLRQADLREGGFFLVAT